MEHTLNKKDEFTVELNVTLNGDDLKPHVDAALQTLASQLEIKGFRKGKVPLDVAKKELDAHAVQHETLQRAVDASVNKIVADEKLLMIDQRDFGIDEQTEDSLKFHLSITVLPDIEIGPYTDLDIKREDIAVTDEEIKQALTEVATARAKIYAVDRPAQDGDRVEIDFTMTQDGKEVEDGKRDNYPIILGQTKLLPGLQKELIGMKNGEDKKVTITLDDEYAQEELRGKTVEVDVKLNQVHAREIPEIDDAFAKSLGAFKDKAALEAQVKESLMQEKTRKEDERIRITILEKISDATTINIPDYLIDQRLDGMVQEFSAQLAQQGMQLELYLTHIKKTEEDLRKQWRPQAEKHVTMDMLIQIVAQKENISVTKKELDESTDNTIKAFAAQQGNDKLKDVDRNRVRANIAYSMLREKVFSFLETKNIAK